MSRPLTALLLLATALAADGAALEPGGVGEVSPRRWVELAASLLALWLLRRRRAPARPERAPQRARRAARVTPAPEPASSGRW